MADPTVRGLTHLRSGKVRDLYEVDDDHLLLVASDRVSTYDVVHPTEVPDKGRVLTAVSRFWFDRLEVPNHLVSTDLADLPVELDPEDAPRPAWPRRCGPPAVHPPRWRTSPGACASSAARR